MHGKAAFVLLLLQLFSVQTLPGPQYAAAASRSSFLPQADGETLRGSTLPRPLDVGRLHNVISHSSAQSIGCPRMRGGSTFEEGFEDQPAKCSHDIEYDSDGWYRHGDYLFRSKDQAHRLVEEPFCVKVAGSVISPLNWPMMVKSLVAGRPQRTVGMRRIRRDENVGPLVMIDGADDIATALQGSGVPQQLRFAMQAFVLYPLVLPIVEFGFRGAEGDHLENRAEAAEARDEVLQHKAAIITKLTKLLSELEAEGDPIAKDIDLEALQASFESNAASTKQKSSWMQWARYLVSAQGTRLPREFRDHVEDARFLKRSKVIVRNLARLDLTAHEEQIERLVRRMAVLEGVVRKAWEPRLRANLTSPLAMFACAGMWWAMLLHELAAFSGFLGGRRILAAGAVARTIAEWILPASQGCMALYGASVGVAGVREASELGQNLQRIKDSSSLDSFLELKASLRHHLEALRSSNAMAEIVAGPALFFGQIFMALGAPSLIGNLPLLALGSVLTAFSIIIKIFVDLDTERKFGYDDDALSVSEILLDNVPASLPSCSHQYELRALKIIQDKRVVYLRELAWIKLLSLLHSAAGPEPSCWRRWFGCLLPPPSRPSSARMGALLAGAQGTYSEGYDVELQRMLHAIVADRSVEQVLSAALPEAHDPLFIAFLFLAVLDDIRPPASDAPAPTCSGAGDKCTHTDKCTDSDEQHLVTAAAARLGEAVERWVGRDRAANMEEVLERLEVQGLSAKLHEAVLDMVMVKGSWGKQLERWHRPFIEVVDCWEERTLKVPGIWGLLHLWTVKHVKQAYRFQADSFLKLYRKIHSPDTAPAKRVALGVQSVDRVADIISRASWRVVEVHRKFQDRSELGCLNEALLELLRQRELRTSLVTGSRSERIAE